MDFAEMPKSFLRRGEDGPSLKGEISVTITDLKNPLTLTDLVVSIWITETNCDVVRILWPLGKEPRRFETDVDKGDMRIIFCGRDLGRFQCFSKGDPEFEPTVVAAFHGRTFKREETVPTGWLELGAVIFNGEAGDPHEIYNFHQYSYDADFSVKPTPLGTGVYLWQGRAKTAKPKYHTHLESGDLGHILQSQQIFLSAVSKDIRSNRIKGIYRNELIGFNIAMAPRAAFYMGWWKRHRVDLDWAECLFKFNFHLFGGGGDNGIGDNMSVYLGHESKEENQRELLLLSLVMFVSRFGYQPDEIKTSNYCRSIETFSQGMFAYGGGDCEDLSWSIWATIKSLQRDDLVVDPKTHPYVDLFRTVFREFEPHACLVQASAPEFSAQSLSAVAVQDPLLVVREGEEVSAVKLEKTEQKAGFFHMVTMMFHKKFFTGTEEDRKEYGRYTIVGEGTSSTYPRIFALPGQCKPPDLGRALYEILATKQAEPGAVTVNLCFGEEAKAPTMYITLLDSTNVDTVVQVRQFCTKEGGGRSDAGVIVDMLVTNPSQIEIVDAEGVQIQNEMSQHVIDEIVSTQLPPPLLTIDRVEFERELGKIQPWANSKVFTFYYSTSPGSRLVPYLPWNLTSKTEKHTVKPWYLGVV